MITTLSNPQAQSFFSPFNNLREFFEGQIDRKMHSLDAPRELLFALRAQLEAHYAEVLGYVDLAIKAVEALCRSSRIR